MSGLTLTPTARIGTRHTTGASGGHRHQHAGKLAGRLPNQEPSKPEPHPAAPERGRQQEYLQEGTGWVLGAGLSGVWGDDASGVRRG